MERQLFRKNKQECFSILYKKSSNEPNCAIHFAHATGFNASTYSSLLLKLSEYSDVYAMDLRGHGETQAIAVPSAHTSWQIYADDITSLTHNIDKPLVLMGHSMGAIASLSSALESTADIRSLILIEPVLPAPFMSFALRLGKSLGLTRYLPIVKGAKRRKANFNSKEDAFSNYKNRGAFKTWPDSYLKNYIAGGFKSTKIGCELNCSPEWESWTFSTVSHDSWKKIAKLNIPLTVICGGKNSTTSRQSIHTLRTLDKDIEVIEIEEASHFLPMEYEDRLVEELKKHLSEIPDKLGVSERVL
jgi:pimeloyl-ACP methyl ester carboxylesterase